MLCCCLAEKYSFKAVLVQLATTLACTFHAYMRAKSFEVAEVGLRLIDTLKGRLFSCFVHKSVMEVYFV